MGRWGAVWRVVHRNFCSCCFFLFRLLGRLWGLGPGGHALPDGSNVGAHPAGLVRNLLWAAADALRGGRAGG